LRPMMLGKLATAQQTVAAARTFPALQAGIAHGFSAASSAERAATWATMRRGNEGVAAAADTAGMDTLWVAERDACVYCLAQSGHLSVDGVFDDSRSFGAAPLPVWPSGALTVPPRHPECRCHLVVYAGHQGPGPSLPEALRREAQRSVLTGLALPSESQVVRRKAAQRLVDGNVALPKTVVARTRHQLIAGTFATHPA
jgi:hypothetical protein